jgi:hypothetical protein
VRNRRPQPGQVTTKPRLEEWVDPGCSNKLCDLPFLILSFVICKMEIVTHKRGFNEMKSINLLEPVSSSLKWRHNSKPTPEGFCDMQMMSDRALWTPKCCSTTNFVTAAIITQRICRG